MDREPCVEDCDFAHLYRYGKVWYCLSGFLIEGTDFDTTYRVELAEEQPDGSRVLVAGRSERIVNIPVVSPPAMTLLEGDDPRRANFDFGAQLTYEWLRQLQIVEQLPSWEELAEENVESSIHATHFMATQYIRKLAEQTAQASPSINMTSVMKELIAFEHQGDALMEALIAYRRKHLQD